MKHLITLCLGLGLATPAFAQYHPDVELLPYDDARYVVCSYYGLQYDPGTNRCEPVEVDLSALPLEQAQERCQSLGLWYDEARKKCAPAMLLPKKLLPEIEPQPRVGTVEVEFGELFVIIDNDHRVRAVPETLHDAVQTVLSDEDPVQAAIDAGFEVVE